MRLLAIISLAGVISACAIFRWTGYQAREQEVPENESMAPMPAPEESAASKTPPGVQVSSQSVNDLQPQRPHPY